MSDATIIKTGSTVGTRKSTLPVTAFAIDSAVVVGAIAVAARLRRSGFILADTTSLANLAIIGPVLALGWLVLLALHGAYDREIFGAGVEEIKRIMAPTAMAAATVGIGCYLLRYPLPRGFFVLAFALGGLGLVVGRYALRRALQRARQDGRLSRRVLVVGTPTSADEITRVLRREKWLGYEVLGALTPFPDTRTHTDAGVPVVGHTEEVTEVAQTLGADVVLLAGGGVSSSAQMRLTMWALETADVHVMVAPNMTEIAGTRVKIRPMGGLPLIHVEKPRAAEALNWAKRAFDVSAASFLMILAAPLLLLAIVRIKSHDGGPVLFRQTRVGRQGRLFSCLKLRTMVPDAEARLRALHLQENYTNGLFKMTNDPRITRPGRWLRRYSIDELPQLWNVLRGDMSLVGPRPPLPNEVANYDRVANRRLQVRPGLTGLWQVSGRSNLSWDETVRLDVYYVDNWSMLQDLSILLKTFRAVFGATGAY